MVRKRGFEPPRGCPRQPLKLSKEVVTRIQPQTVLTDGTQIRASVCVRDDFFRTNSHTGQPLVRRVSGSQEADLRGSEPSTATAERQSCRPAWLRCRTECATCDLLRRMRESLRLKRRPPLSGPFERGVYALSGSPSTQDDPPEPLVAPMANDGAEGEGSTLVRNASIGEPTL